jgi:outer membrane receptor protein involved in Fe transport
MVSVALFGKEFTDPIETVVKVNAADGNTLEQTYRNAQSASSYGIELDYRKRFGFLGHGFDNLLFAANVALIQSKVTIENDPNDPFVSGLTTKDRPMQGQSPYVVNLQLGYDDKDKGDSALFLFNQIGERIVVLGTDKNEDQYQQPFAKLDFVTQWKLNNYYLKDSDFIYSLKFKASNLLDSEQTVTQGDLTTLSTKPGRDFSLSLKIAY